MVLEQLAEVAAGNGKAHPSSALTVRADGIPAALKAQRRWIAWRWAPKKNEPGEWTKLPVVPGTNSGKGWPQPEAWTNFKTALAFAQQNGLAGVGWVFEENDPVSGVDLDDCRDPRTGALAPWAALAVEQLATYAEVSPSSTGVKLWVRCKKLPGDGGNSGRGVEMYDHGRWFAVTGHRLPQAPADVQEPPAGALEAFYLASFGGRDGHPEGARRPLAELLQGFSKGSQDGGLVELSKFLASADVAYAQAVQVVRYVAEQSDPPVSDEDAIGRLQRIYERMGHTRELHYRVDEDGGDVTIYRDMTPPPPVAAGWRRTLATKEERALLAAGAPGWLGRYIAWAGASTDAPMALHLFAGLTALSVPVGRTLVVPLRYASVFPNLYLLGLAPSGARKTTAFGYADELVEAVLPEAHIAEDITPEALAVRLQKRDGMPCLQIYDEVSGYLERANRGESYLAGLSTLMCKVYSGSAVRVERRRDPEPIVVHSPHLTFLGATTIDLFTEHASERMVYSGWLPRFLVSVATDVNYRPPTLADEEHYRGRQALEEGLHTLVGHLARIQTVAAVELQTESRISVSAEALERFGEYEEALRGLVPDNEFLKTYYTRHAMHALKVAMLLRVGIDLCDPDRAWVWEEGELLRLELSDVQWAVALVEQCRIEATPAVEAIRGKDVARVARRIVVYVGRRYRGERAGERGPEGAGEPGKSVRRRAIAQNLGIDKKTLDLALETAVDWGDLRRNKEGDEYWPRETEVSGEEGL